MQQIFVLFLFCFCSIARVSGTRAGWHEIDTPLGPELFFIPSPIQRESPTCINHLGELNQEKTIPHNHINRMESKLDQQPNQIQSECSSPSITDQGRCSDDTRTTSTSPPSLVSTISSVNTELRSSSNRDVVPDKGNCIRIRAHSAPPPSRLFERQYADRDRSPLMIDPLQPQKAPFCLPLHFQIGGIAPNSEYQRQQLHNASIADTADEKPDFVLNQCNKSLTDRIGNAKQESRSNVVQSRNEPEMSPTPNFQQRNGTDSDEAQRQQEVKNEDDSSKMDGDRPPVIRNEDPSADDGLLKKKQSADAAADLSLRHAGSKRNKKDRKKKGVTALSEKEENALLEMHIAAAQAERQQVYITLTIYESADSSLRLPFERDLVQHFESDLIVIPKLAAHSLSPISRSFIQHPQHPQYQRVVERLGDPLNYAPSILLNGMMNCFEIHLRSSRQQNTGAQSVQLYEYQPLSLFKWLAGVISGFTKSRRDTRHAQYYTTFMAESNHNLTADEMKIFRMAEVMDETLKSSIVPLNEMPLMKVISVFVQWLIDNILKDEQREMIEKHQRVKMSADLAPYYGNDYVEFGEILNVEIGNFQRSMNSAMQSLSKLVEIEGMVTSEDTKLAYNNLIEVCILDTKWVITKTMLDLMITIDHWVTIPQPAPCHIHMTKFGELWCDAHWEIMDAIADAHHLEVDRKIVHSWRPLESDQLQARRRSHAKSKREKRMSSKQRDQSNVLWDKYCLHNI